MATSFVAFARRVVDYKSDDDLLFGIKELGDCVVKTDPDGDATMARHVSMLRRHAEGVLNVLSKQIALASDLLAAGKLPPTCLVVLNRPALSTRPLELLRQPAPLSAGEEARFTAEGFNSRLLIQIDGRLSGRKSNLVLVGGEAVSIDDANFVLLLRLILQLWTTSDGYLRLLDIRRDVTFGAEQGLIPDGLPQALSRLRKYFRGRVGSLSHREFIENKRGRVRLSTHPRLVMVDCGALANHDNELVQKLAARIGEAASLGATGDGDSKE
jgi:hypothetical protein